MTTSKIKIRSITLEIDSKNVLETSSVKEISEKLRSLAFNIVNNDLFVKVKYSIKWEDGKFHVGHYPLKKQDATVDFSTPLFSIHLTKMFMVRGGIEKPYEMTPEKYEEWLKDRNLRYPGYSEHSRNFFKYYEY